MTPTRRPGDPLTGVTPPKFSQLSHAALTILVDADPHDSQTPVKARSLFNGIPLQARAALTPATISNKDRLFTPGANPVFTFVRPASFLNRQSELNAIFPEPIALTLEPGTISATEGYLTTTGMFQAFLTTAMLQTLISDSRLLYVGTRSQAVQIAVVQNTLHRLGALRFHQREPDQRHDWTPNTLFDHYITESNNLPEDCTTWSSPTHFPLLRQPARGRSNRRNQRTQLRLSVQRPVNLQGPTSPTEHPPHPCQPGVDAA